MFQSIEVDRSSVVHACAKGPIPYDSAMDSGADSKPNGPAHIRHNTLLTGCVVLLFFFALWVLYFWPAIVNEWWAVDDYYFLVHRTIEKQNTFAYLINFFRTGRPLSILWIHLIKYYVTNMPLQVAGIAPRLLQGIFHTVCALLIGMIFVRFTRRKSALLTVLPFLLWPFGSEATTWISAVGYPIAALLSILGLMLLISKDRISLVYRLTGILLIALSPFSNQAGCLSGLLVYCILLALSLYDHQHRSALFRILPTVLFSYFVGLVLQSTVLILLQENRFARLTTGGLGDHMLKQFELTFTFLFSNPSLYPSWLVIVHYVFLALALISIFLLSSAPTLWKATIGGFTVILLGCAFLFILRATTIITGIDWVSGRTMYLDPLLFSFALCLILQSRLRPAINTLIVAILLIVLVAGYYPISVSNARENVSVFENDLKTLRHLETLARAEDTDQLLIAYLPFGKPSDNPYSIRYYNFGDIHHTVFRTRLYSIPFVEFFSKELHLIREPEKIAYCVQSCPNTEQPKRWIGVIEQPVRALCLCP